MNNKQVAAILIRLVVISGLLCPGSTWSQAGSADDVDARFQRVNQMRAQDDLDGAIRILREIIQEHSSSEAILRRAYNELVYSIYQKRDNATGETDRDRLDALMDAEAKKALLLFPDLMVDQNDANIPPREVNSRYNTLRRLIFGSLVVTTVPDSSRIFIDGTHRGASPLTIEHIPYGDYTLTATKSGYEDKEIALRIEAGRTTVQSGLELDRARTRKWWLTRVVAPVAVGIGGIVALVLRDNTQPVPEPEPLPGPPAPPTQ